MAITWTNCSASPGAFFQNFTGGTLSYASVNGGAAIPSGSKVIAYMSSNSSAGTPTATMGSLTLTAVSGEALGQSPNCAGVMFWGDALSSLTDTLAFGGVTGGGFFLLGVQCGFLTGAATGAPSATMTNVFGAQNAPSAAITIPSGGCAVAGIDTGGSGFAFTPATAVWTNATQKQFSSATNGSTSQFQCDMGVNLSGTGASVTISATLPASTGFANAMIASAWAAGTVVTSPKYRRLDVRLRR